MKSWDNVANLVVALGAVNWGLLGLLNLNVVSSILGTGSALEKIVYVMVGAAGVWCLWKKFGGK